MVKRKKSVGVVVGVSLGVFALVVIFVSLILSGAFQNTSLPGGSGLSVLSVSAPNVVSKSADLKSLNWLVTTRLSGSDRIQYTLSPSEAQSKSGVATQEPFSITANRIDESLNYRVILQNDYSIYDYSVTAITDASVACPGDVVQEFLLTRLFFSNQHFCVVRTLDGRYGSLSNPTRDYSADLVISNSIDTLTQHIDNHVSSVEFRQNGALLATATWQGSFITGNPDPTVPELMVITGSSGRVWRPLSRTKFTTWQAKENTFIGQVHKQYSDWSGTITSTGSLAQARDSLQSLATQLSSDKQSSVSNFDSLTNGLTLLSPTSQDGASLTFSSATQLSNPVITWWIRADWLGVQRLAGQPQIVSVNAPEFGNGDSGRINVQVKNVGDDSTFVAYLKSCTSFTSTYSGTEFSALAGVVSSTQVFVDPQAKNANLKDTCNVCVRDRALPSNEDCKSVSLSFKATQVCSPGQYTVDLSQNAIYVCNTDGLGKTLITSCAVGQSPKFTGGGSTGGYECTSSGAGNSGASGGACLIGGITIFGQNIGGSSAPQFVCDIGGLTGIFGILLGIIAAIIVGLIVKDIAERNNRKSGPGAKLLFVITGLAAGVIVYVMMLTLWWLATIFFVLFIIVKIIINKVVG